MKTIKSLLAVSVLAASTANAAIFPLSITFIDKWQNYGWSSTRKAANLDIKYGVGMTSGTGGYFDTATGQLKFDGTNGSSFVESVYFMTTDLTTDPASPPAGLNPQYHAWWTYVFHGTVDPVNNTYTMTGIAATLVHCAPFIIGNIGACSMGPDGTVWGYNFPDSSTSATPPSVPLTISLAAAAETYATRQGKMSVFPVFSVDSMCFGSDDYWGWGYGQSQCNPPLAQVMPVPAAAWLFGSGLLGLVGTARRRKLKAV